MALPGTKLEDVKEIRSQSYAIDQCRSFLTSIVKEDIVLNQTVDTASSAAVIQKKQLKNT
jgi:prephenate dehydratase